MTSPFTLWRDPAAPDWRNASIEGWHYTSAVRSAEERAAIFARSWQLVGRQDQLCEPGDYLTCTVAGESVLVVQDGGDALHAFYNVCRHRGRELVDPWTCGRTRQLQCRYHGWVYGLDGRVRAVPDESAFPDLEAGTLGLAPLQVDVWHGLVFVKVEPGGESLREHFDELEECLPQAFEPAVLVAAKTLQLNANWKVAIEAFIETNHIASLHPRVSKGLRFDETAVAHLRRHSLTVLPTKLAHDWGARRRESWRAWITDPATSEIHYSIFPNVTVHLFVSGLTFLFRFLPDGKDPELTRLDVWTWKRLQEGETPPPPMSMPDAMGEVFRQDYENIPFVQRGVRSRAFRGPLLNVFESRIGHFHGVVDGFLRARGNQPDALDTSFTRTS